MVAVRPPTESTCIVLRGNHSLPARSALFVFLVLAASAVLIAILFLLAGAWPVVPFLGIELIAVGAVLCLLCRRARDCELLMFDDDRLRIIQRSGRREQCHEFHRYWARVALEPVRNGWYPPRLVIRSHGREVEIGARINQDELERVAARLRTELGPDYR
jgi:uncharacterized membrane protein